jgi:hypothetical protein
VIGDTHPRAQGDLSGDADDVKEVGPLLDRPQGDEESLAVVAGI